MEIHLFNTQDVQRKLNDLGELLNLLETSIIGLEALGTLNKSTVGGLLTVIEITRSKTLELENCRQSISLDWNEQRTAVLIGTD